MAGGLAGALALLAVAVAAGLQVASGSGFGLIAAPLLLLILPPAVPVPLLLITVPVMLLTVWQNRSGLAAGFELWPVVALAAPSAVGLALVQPASLAPSVLLAIGVIELAAAVAGLRGWTLPQSRRVLLAVGAFSGALTTLVATPGPPVVVAYRNPDPAGYRANLSVYYLLITLVSLGLLTAWHGLTGATAVRAAMLLPGVLAGWPLGVWLARRLSSGLLRPAALVLAGAAGVGLIVKGLWQL